MVKVRAYIIHIMADQYNGYKNCCASTDVQTETFLNSQKEPLLLLCFQTYLEVPPPAKILHRDYLVQQQSNEVSSV